MENAVVLREWFDRVDAGRTGNITAPQLQSALAVGNLDFPLSVVQQMIRMYDFDRNGTMNFEEFRALNKFLQKVQNVFSTLERDRGFLSLEEVYEALIKLGFSLDSPAFYTVCESFDKSKKGMVHLDEFISLCIFVQSARNLFSSFDTSKQGRVTLDFNQFVYCSEFLFPVSMSLLLYLVLHFRWHVFLEHIENDTLSSCLVLQRQTAGCSFYLALVHGETNKKFAL